VTIEAADSARRAQFALRASLGCAALPVARRALCVGCFAAGLRVAAFRFEGFGPSTALSSSSSASRV
jgi:hypothetical protein